MLDFVSSLLLWPDGFNAQIVMVSALMIGITCACLGVFIVLNRQALISDVAAHATLPGIAIGVFLTYIAQSFWPVPDIFHSLLITLCAFGFGGLGVFSVRWITQNSVLKQDTAMAVVLSMFYGFGVVLFSVLQRLSGISIAGLDRFLLGQIAGTQSSETFIIIVVCLCVLLIGALLFKHLTALCFDPVFFEVHHKAQHRTVSMVLIWVMMALIVTGLKTAGVLLIVALMVIPVCAARLLSRRMGTLTAVSVLLGGLASYSGVQFSAYYNHVPTGSMIVLCMTALFLIAAVLHLALNKRLQTRRADHE